MVRTVVMAIMMKVVTMMTNKPGGGWEDSDYDIDNEEDCRENMTNMPGGGWDDNHPST